MLNVQSAGMTASLSELLVRTVFGWGTEDATNSLLLADASSDI